MYTKGNRTNKADVEGYRVNQNAGGVILSVVSVVGVALYQVHHFADVRRGRAGLFCDPVTSSTLPVYP